MFFRFAIVPLIAATAFTIGCSKSDQPAQAPASSTSPEGGSSTETAPAQIPGAPASSSDAELIRQAVEEHIRNDRGINMSAMDMSVDSISVNGDQAQANATFRIKQGGASMAMVYSLERRGSGWIVVNGHPGDGQFVHPPVDKTHSGMPANPSAPAVPDVQNFFKSHPATNSN